jgi:hypothetical protein
MIYKYCYLLLIKLLIDGSKNSQRLYTELKMHARKASDHFFYLATKYL